MDNKKYRQIRAIVALFIGIITSISISINNYLLSVIAVLTGILFLTVVRSRVKVIVDERENAVRQKAAQITYSIFAPPIGLGSFFLFIFSQKGFYYLESLGVIFAYLTLFLMAIYSISYFFINQKLGGTSHDE